MNLHSQGSESTEASKSIIHIPIYPYLHTKKLNDRPRGMSCSVGKRGVKPFDGVANDFTNHKKVGLNLVWLLKLLMVTTNSCIFCLESGYRMYNS